MGINLKKKKDLTKPSEVGFLTIILLSPILQVEKLRHRLSDPPKSHIGKGRI